MEDQLIEDENLISKFMDLAISRKDIYPFVDGLVFVDDENGSPDWIDPEFHSSWDWLMPVVAKINELIDTDGHSRGKAFVTISNSHDALVSANIKKVFKAVVEFIKWYNEDKKRLKRKLS